MSRSERTDLDLARRAGVGEIAAFEQLVRRHEARLRAMLRRLAGDSADDIAQETFLAAWRFAAKWRGEGSYFAWLARIAWRQFLSRRRKERPTEPLDQAANQSTPPDAVRRSVIDQAMGRLSDRERMAALLCFAHGCAHAEAADIMDIPLGTLKSVVARARETLIHCLEDEQ